MPSTKDDTQQTSFIQNNTKAILMQKSQILNDIADQIKDLKQK